VGWGKSGVLEHKSGNISERRKDRGKVIMEGTGTHHSRPLAYTPSTRLEVRNPTKNTNRKFRENECEYRPLGAKSL